MVELMVLLAMDCALSGLVAVLAGVGPPTWLAVMVPVARARCGHRSRSPHRYS